MCAKRRDAGETLVETLITVVLLGILAAGVVGALSSTIMVSDLDAQQAGGEAVLRSYAEAWDRTPYRPCTAGSSADPYPSGTPSGFTPPNGYTASVTSVEFWNGTSSAPAVFAGTCPAIGDTGYQQINLEVIVRRGPPLTLTIEKRTP